MWKTFRGGVSRKQVLRSARCARGDVGAPRRRASAGPRCHVSCGASGAPLYPLLPTAPPCGGCRECGFWRGGEAGGCGFPRLGFPPGAPLSEAPPSTADHRPGGKPIPVHSLRSFTGGNRTAASCVYSAAALRVPPPEIPRRSLNTPVPPQSCGGRSRAAQARRGSHCSGASAVAAVPARPSANRSRRLRAWPASFDLRAALRPFR